MAAATPAEKYPADHRLGMKIPFQHKHLLGISQLNQYEILELLDRAEAMIPISRQPRKILPTLSGKTQINLFFEPSTRTQASFEIAGKRLGAQVMNMSVRTSSVSKGETLIDTAATLNAMRPDVIIVRHSAAGAVELLSQKVGCSVINAGDGAHEHPTQALLDALTIRQHKGRLAGLTVAICEGSARRPDGRNLRRYRQFACRPLKPLAAWSDAGADSRHRAAHTPAPRHREADDRSLHQHARGARWR
jgi:hypothetical protein